MSKGKLIVFEGLDGSGKSGQIKELLFALRKEGIAHCAIREPGGTQIGEDIRTILKTRYTGDQKTRMTELLLFFASRAALVKRIREILDSGIMVVMDRFYLSSIAYQGAGLDLMEETLTLCDMVLGDLRPDLTILLDVVPEVGLTRVLERDGKLDEIESRELNYHQMLRQTFLEYALPVSRGRMTHTYMTDDSLYEVVDATQSFEAVTDEVYAVCKRHGIFT